MAPGMATIVIKTVMLVLSRLDRARAGSRPSEIKRKVTTTANIPAVNALRLPVNSFKVGI